MSTTLTFQAGADGSRPSQAECVSVVIIDDLVPEETEYLTFNIASLDTSRVVVDESRSQKVLRIIDNDGKYAV